MSTYIPSSVEPSVPIAKSTIYKESGPKFYSDAVKLDPDSILPLEYKNRFVTLLYDYDQVFSPDLQGYNGAVGPFEAVVNMGPIAPPQRKGRIPQYSCDKLVELQSKFDAL